MLFTNEVNTMEELIENIKDYNFEHQIKVGVVCFLYDTKGNLILQRRGPGARDEIGKLQAIGGSFNKSDGSFREGLRRELIEEAGNEAVIEINEFIAAQHSPNYDKNLDQFTDWIVLAYKGVLLSGKLINSEPDRSLGFERAHIEDFDEIDLSKSASNFINYIKSIKNQ